MVWKEMIYLIEKKIVIEENIYLEKFFEHNRKYEDYIRNRIYKCTLDLINNNPHKIKKVRGYKYKSKTIYEYKIPLESGLDCRVAYIFHKEVFLNLDEKELKRTLKYLQKKEFPKSNKLWYKIIRTKK